MKHKNLAIAVLALGLWVGEAQAAPKKVTLINKCGRAVKVAVASYVSSIGGFYWVVEGWIDLAPNETKTRNVSPNRYPYVHAHIPGNPGTLTGNDSTLCVSNKAFSLKFYKEVNPAQKFVIGADGFQQTGPSCEAAGGSMRGGFQKLDFEGKYSNINFTIECSL